MSIHLKIFLFAKPFMRVTQQDIARLANVSQATVSRVLAGDVRVEDAKRTRVQSAMDQVNYQPDVRAQALRRRKTHLIGLVIQRDASTVKDDPFFSILVAEIARTLAKTKFHFCLDIADTSSSQSQIYDELLRTRRVDGLIVVEPQMDDVRLSKLQADRFPFVVIGNPRGASLHSVDNDNVLCARTAAMHLIDNGFKKIAFLAGPERVTVADDRVAGYSMAMAQHGMKPIIMRTAFGIEAASAAAEKLLSCEDRPDALLVMDDYLAIGALRAAAKLGLSVPGDLGMVSFNDTFLTTIPEGGLSSVNMNFELLVQQAVKKLVELIEGLEEQSSTRHVVPCELKVRGSSQKH